MNATQIRLQFPNCPRIITADRGYAEVKRSYLLGSYYDWFRAFLFGGPKDRPIKWDPKFDCDDFARLYAALIQLSHFQSTGSAEEGVAVGEIHYCRNGDMLQGHAICCAFTDVGRIFIEPQTGQELQLSNEEIASISFVRF